MAYAVGRDVVLDALDWTDQRPRGLMEAGCGYVDAARYLFTLAFVGHSNVVSAGDSCPR
jgi:hypothetical protein